MWNIFLYVFSFYLYFIINSISSYPVLKSKLYCFECKQKCFRNGICFLIVKSFIILALKYVCSYYCVTVKPLYLDVLNVKLLNALQKKPNFNPKKPNFNLSPPNFNEIFLVFDSGFLDSYYEKGWYADPGK